MLLNESGGIIDDTIITKHASDAYYVVTNAGRRNEDLAWFGQKLKEWNENKSGREGPVEHEVLENWGLLAIQGNQPAALARRHRLKIPVFRSRSCVILTKLNII